MGTSLSGLTPATTFDGLLKVGDNDPLTADLKAISDGSGNDSALQLSTGELKVGVQFNVDTDGDLTSFNLRGNGLNINQIYHANETTYNTIAMANSAGISMKNGTGTALLVRGGNVGIGGITATPTARLQVNGSGATSATTSLLVQNSAGTDLFSIKDDGLFTLNDNGGGDALTIENGSNISQIRYNDNLWLGSSHGAYAPTIKIDRIAGLSVETTGGSLLNLLYDTGNLGIGETTPTARLHIKGSGNDNTTTSLLVENSDASVSLKYDDSGELYLTGSKAQITLQKDGSDGGVIGNNNSRTWFGSSTALVYLGGKIGINNQTPSAQLHIKGSGATSATTALLVQNSAGTEHLKITDDGVVNVRQNLIVNHSSVSSRALRLSWGSIYGTDNSSEVRIGAVLSEAATAPRITLSGKTRASGADAVQVQTLNGMYIAPTANAEDPSAQLHIKGSGNDNTTTALLVQNSDGANAFRITDNKIGHFFSHLNIDGQNYVAGNLSAGSSSVPSGTRAYIKGSGATSATTALLVENSAGTDLLKVEDGGIVVATTFRAGASIVQQGSFRINQQWLVSGAGGQGLKIGTSNSAPNNSAKLEVDSTTQGFLPPRMTDAERDAITSPAPGLMVYDTSNNQMNYWNGTTWIAF